jgi:hypothetical protein
MKIENHSDTAAAAKDLIAWEAEEARTQRERSEEEAFWEKEPEADGHWMDNPQEAYAATTEEFELYDFE